MEGATRIRKLTSDTPIRLWGRTEKPIPQSKRGNFRHNINASDYPPARSTGNAMLKYGARGGYCGQSHGRVVIAQSGPEILSAGDTKQKTASIFAALRPKEHMLKSAPP